MKTLLIALSLTAVLVGFAYADNCYIFDRWSDAWNNCKDQAAQNDKINAKLDQNLRDIGTQDANAAANDSLAEQQKLYGTQQNQQPNWFDQQKQQ